VDADVGQLDALADRLEAFDKIGVAIANDAVAGVELEARKTASAGTTPEGTAWQPNKDGSAPLEHASSAIRAVVSGTTKAVITLVLSGVYVFHQRSKSRGKKGLPRREILQLDGVPPAIVDVIATSAHRIVARAATGGPR
jgi:hypothetical protein